MNPKLIGVVLSFAIAACAHGRDQSSLGCKKNPAVVSACYSLRGRISAYNGTPSLRIWPVGSARLLGILPAENEILPNTIRGMVSFDQSVFANLVVCPFTQVRSGAMQFVCVESAVNVALVPRH
jgi:hypothetical protein